jgi:ABC-type sugar transport system substrate-binding protein
MWNPRNIFNESKWLAAIVTAIVIGIVVCAIDVINVDGTVVKYQISVIVDDSNSARWDSFQTGLRQAARENGIRLNYVTTDFEGSPLQEKNLIDQEIENGADAVIVQLCSGSGGIDILSDVPANVYIELIDNNVEKEELDNSRISFIGADSVQVSSELATRIEQDLGDLTGVRIGILAGNLKLASVQERINAFKEVSQEAGAQIVFSVEATELTEREIGELVSNNDADILVALDNDVTETAADYIQMVDSYNSYPTNGRKNVKLYGIGCSPENLSGLDQGIIGGMVVINEYEMGYMAINSLVDVLKDERSKVSDYTVGYAYVTGETMYDEGNQQILFPIGD